MKIATDQLLAIMAASIAAGNEAYAGADADDTTPDRVAARSLAIAKAILADVGATPHRTVAVLDPRPAGVPPSPDAVRLDWLDDTGRLEDVRGRVINEGGTVREAIDWFRDRELEGGGEENVMRVFDMAWERLSKEGACDDIDGMEHARVSAEYKVAFRRGDIREFGDLERFIRQRANVGPDAPVLPTEG